jgi:hypothetical protein
LVCELEPVEPGEFASDIHLFVDANGAYEVVFSVHGIARPAESGRQPEAK